MEQKERVKMSELRADERIRPPKAYDEVALGYTEEEAVTESKRCIQCKNPQCVKGCPVEIDIPRFIKKITERDFQESVRIIKEKNNLPAICGRVCPQETQCEQKCILGKKGSPIAIGALERFVADWQIKNMTEFPKTNIKLKEKIAVVGSGPAGLTCAGDLARSGYKVTIFEALHEPGGVLRYGIPSFRLPREILDYEINYIKSLGVEIICNVLIGKTYTISELFNMGYNSIFIGSGAGLPYFPKISGMNLCRIYSANEFLTRINLMHADKFPEYDTPINIGNRVTVIGGGNTAMDSARCSLRLINSLTRNSRSVDSSVTIIYRRTEQEMPARAAEIEHVKEEGINFMFLTQPVRFIGDNRGFVTGIECLKCELGAPDETGRRRPIPIKGSEFVIETDTVIIAVGLKSNPLIPKTTPDIKTNSDGDIIVNSETMETTLANVYAGGDIVGGEGTVIEAMGMGKRAAKSIIQKLS